MLGGNPNSKANGMNDSRVSTSTVMDSLSESEKKNIISKQNDPNAFDGVSSAGVALGIPESELHSK